MLIKTIQGQIEELPVDGGTAYLSICFGEPPVDELRFMPPRAATPWSGVHGGTRWPNRAMQSKKLGTMDQATPGERSEDCLFLNVQTPIADGAGRPVMVGVHGGGFSWWGANEYDGRVRELRITRYCLPGERSEERISSNGKHCG